jgi:hypothetical protein
MGAKRDVQDVEAVKKVSAKGDVQESKSQGRYKEASAKGDMQDVVERAGAKGDICAKPEKKIDGAIKSSECELLFPETKHQSR